MRVSIIGGGIVGLAASHYLGQRGVDVVVLEKSTIGAGSTDRANGGIRAQFSSPVSARLSQESIAVWKRFEELFDTAIGYRRPGYLFLARRESTAERFRENVRQQNRLGVDSEFLTPVEAENRCPELRTEEFRGATYRAADGFADPHLALQGFSAAANEAGAEIRTGVAVTDVLQEETGERVTGVRTDEGTIESDYVVNAAGAWASRVGKMAGLDLPIVPRRRQLMVADPEIPIDSSIPFTIDLDQSVHFRPERDGGAVVGGHFADADPTMNPDDYRKKMDLDWAAEAIEAAAECADYFGPDSRVKRGWAGLYAVTPDHHPIIDETLPGFVTAAGFSGHGFMQAPATGKLVAELIDEGEPSLVDVSSLGADRFDRDAHLEEGTVIN
ncbi:NAD(P)/FAD-dependent oxidoreductase [Halococcus saccharolyticus]|uniref:FAD dependent oxidoreductase n=1 Tax=Halococcus saccharolyticus DSM 5350 TaxID=1227455 RepID=M0MM72_9EURY|nr:FAD-dependent oxidoreductase [Halococcus saccharolyticus]EMA46797.1 FAD dependent oxidoreductase [Halococcus saccharolyticus DSM 5350]